MRNFMISALWPPRPETPTQIARRLKSLLALLRPITPHFERWFFRLGEDAIPEIDETENWLVGAIAADVCKDDLGAPAPALGYLSVIMNTPETDLSRTESVFIHSMVGSTFINKVALHDSHQLDWHPELVAYPVAKQTVLAFSKAFEPLWCDAKPLCLQKTVAKSRYKDEPVMTPCWMIHLSPAFARRVTPPLDIVSERFADGSLFMSATDETFDPENSAHIDAANRLFAAIDPLQEKLPPR